MNDISKLRQNYVVKYSSNGRELIERLVEHCGIHFEDDPEKIERWYVNLLAGDEWTPRWQSPSKQIRRKLLLPLLKTEIVKEGEKINIIFRKINILICKNSKQNGKFDRRMQCPRNANHK